MKNDPPMPLINGEKTFFQKLLTQRQLFFMSAPIVAYVVLFAYVPLAGWTMAFQNYKPALSFSQQEWVGLKWFVYLFKEPEFLRALRNTIAMSFINMALGYVTAIALALMLNELKSVLFKRTVQTISYLPHFLSWVIVTGLVAGVLSVEGGILNDFLLALRLIKEPIPWLGNPQYFWGIIGLTYVWKEVGWNTIIYLAAITAIDPTLYEAASIDGCGRFKKMWFITLPGIKTTIIVLMIMSIGNILNAGFELQYLLRNGQVQEVSDTIDIFVMIFGFRHRNYALATAAGIFKNVVNISILFLANFMAKRMGEERLI